VFVLRAPLSSDVPVLLLNQPIDKMAERWFADLVLLPVTAAIYRNGEEKPAMRWSLEMGIGGESDKILFDFIFE